MSDSILAAIDFSDVTQAVLDEAASLAKALQVKIWLVHVADAEPTFVGYEVGPVYVRDQVAEQLRSQHRTLQEHQEALQGRGLDVTAMLVPGTPAEKILSEAKDLGAGHIVVGSHGHGALHTLLMGSVSSGVVKEAPCPVVVVPSREMTQTDSEGD